MSLPKLTHPVHEFETSYGTSIKFRQYTFKEEKILLMAAADQSPTPQKILDTIKQIMASCLISPDITSLKISEIEEFFVRLRSMSSSNTVALVYTPPASCVNEKCPDEIELSALLDNYKMETHSGKTFEQMGYKKNKHGWVVELTPTAGIILKEPSIIGTPEEVLWDSVVSVYVGEEYWTKNDFTVESLNEFIDDLPHKSINKIKQFFDCIPTVSVDVPIKCNVCGMQKTKTIKGLYNFFA